MHAGVSLKALRRNMMRTVLTMLGVIIGVSAVICTVANGEGASTKIREAIASIGANVGWVEARPGTGNQGPGIGDRYRSRWNGTLVTTTRERKRSAPLISSARWL